MKTITHPTPRLTATAAIPGAPVSLPRGGEFLTCRPPASVARISAHPTYPLRATAGIPTAPRSIKALIVSAGMPCAPASFPRPVKALSVSAGIPTAPISLPGGRPFLTCRLPSPRSAFTLVELLVVIVILAMLASLVTVAASRALAAARNAALEEAAARVERLSAKYALSHPAVAADLRGLAMSLMDEAAIRALIDRGLRERKGVFRWR